MSEYLIKAIENAVGEITGIFLFGSHVVGTPDEHSDIDVVVLKEGVSTLVRKKFTTTVGSIDLHLHSLTSLTKAWTDQRKKHISFYTHAFATGQTVMDPSSHFASFIEESRKTWPKNQAAVDWMAHRMALMSKLGDLKRHQDDTARTLLSVELYQHILAVQCLYFKGWLATAMLMRKWCAEVRPYSIERLDHALAEAIAGKLDALIFVASYWLTRIGGELTADDRLVWSGIAA